MEQTIPVSTLTTLCRRWVAEAHGLRVAARDKTLAHHDHDGTRASFIGRADELEIDAVALARTLGAGQCPGRAGSACGVALIPGDTLCIWCKAERPRLRLAPNPTDFYAMVKAFHNKFGVAAPDTPTDPPPATRVLRLDLILEELQELATSMGAPGILLNMMREARIWLQHPEIAPWDASGIMPAIADALADLAYVTIGAAVTYGIDLRPVFAAVHAANMAKTGGAIRDDGKILKPAGWRPPDVASVLRAQGWQPPAGALADGTIIEEQ